MENLSTINQNIKKLNVDDEYMNRPPMSAAIKIPSLYFKATTDVPVTYRSLKNFHKS